MDDEKPTEPGTDVQPAEPSPPGVEEQPAPAAPAERREPRGVGVWATVVGTVLVAAAFLVFVAQNTENVHVQWTVWSVDFSLAAVVFGAMLLGSVLTLLVAAIWRIGRRRRLREREELHRLRGAGG